MDTRSHRTLVTTPGDCSIVITRVFDASRALVFEAHTGPDHVRTWLLGPPGWSMPVCEIDLRVGGAWRYLYANADGRDMDMHGVYLEIDRPERVVTTECWGGGWPETVNTLVLHEAEGRTTMTSTMLFPTPKARDAAMNTGMSDSLDLTYDRLADHLDGLA